MSESQGSEFNDADRKPGAEEDYPPGDETDEETEPTELNEENPGIEGQILYPERTVDAERAGAYAAGKVDTLEPEDEEDETEASEDEERA